MEFSGSWVFRPVPWASFFVSDELIGNRGGSRLLFCVFVSPRSVLAIVMSFNAPCREMDGFTAEFGGTRGGASDMSIELLEDALTASDVDGQGINLQQGGWVRIFTSDNADQMFGDIQRGFGAYRNICDLARL